MEIPKNLDARIMIAGGNKNELNLMRGSLRLKGYHNVDGVEDLQDTFELFSEQFPDLLVVNEGLWHRSALNLLDRVREFSMIPVSFVGIDNNPEHIADVLDKGADDYLVMGQFGPEQFVLKVEALLRRQQLAGSVVKPPPNFENDGLMIDYGQHLVTLYGEEVVLTRTDFKLLAQLSHHAGKVMMREDLLAKVWGPGSLDDNHLLSVNITRVRAKLGENSDNPHYIVTERYAGYKMPLYQVD
jgi:two-component system, OmpR family, KDP operon response regulator KdpE